MGNTIRPSGAEDLPDMPVDSTEVGASEDYLSRVFNRELGLSPWEYLNRYRIYQA